MLDIYYKIWVDAIRKINRSPLYKRDWKWMTQAHITTMMGLNLMFLSSIIQKSIIGKFYYDINIELFKNDNYNGFIESIIMFFLPPFLLNYFLIFRNQKYEVLLEKYKDIKEYYFFSYYFGSMIIMLLVLLIGMFLYR